jgi:hypothetical protein
MMTHAHEKEEDNSDAAAAVMMIVTTVMCRLFDRVRVCVENIVTKQCSTKVGRIVGDLIYAFALLPATLGSCELQQP